MLGMQVRYTEIAILSQLAPPRAIRTASAIHPAATDRGELMTLIAGKRQRQRLFMAADDDEVS